MTSMQRQPEKGKPMRAGIVGGFTVTEQRGANHGSSGIKPVPAKVEQAKKEGT